MATLLYGRAPTNQNMPRTSLVSNPIRDSLSKIPQRSARRPISFGRELLHYLKDLAYCITLHVRNSRLAAPHSSEGEQRKRRPDVCGHCLTEFRRVICLRGDSFFPAPFST